MINQLTILFIHSVVSINRSIVRNIEYLLVIAVAVGFVSYCYGLILISLEHL